MKRIDLNLRHFATIAVFFLPCLCLSCGGGNYKTDELLGEIDSYLANKPGMSEKQYQVDLFAKMKPINEHACIAYCFGDDRSKEIVFFDEATSKILSQTSYKKVFAAKINSAGDKAKLDEDRLRHLTGLYEQENVSYEAPKEDFAIEKAPSLCGDSLFLFSNGKATIESPETKSGPNSQYKNILFFILK